jgi:hypothetical protein
MHDAVVQVHTDPVQIAVQAGSIFDPEAIREQGKGEEMSYSGAPLSVPMSIPASWGTVVAWAAVCSAWRSRRAWLYWRISSLLEQASPLVVGKIPAAGLAGPTRAYTRTLEPTGADRTGFSGTTCFSP